MAAEAGEYKVQEIPADICREVLSYLPVKSLLRFTSVCKRWKSIIHDPMFALLHLGRYRNNHRQSDQILLENDGKAWKRVFDFSCHRVSNEFSSYKQTNTKLHVPIPPRADETCVSQLLHIHGDMDGLFLMQWVPLPYKWRIDVTDVFLWNPSMRKIIKVPVVEDPKMFLNLNLGFDPLTSEYKVVKLNSEKAYIYPEVFSVNTRSWRKGAILPGIGTLIDNRSENKLSLGDSVYWIGMEHWHYHEDDCYQFVSLNMSYERLSYTELPDVYPFRLSECTLNPVAVSGSLVGLLISNVFMTEIWVLERSPEDGIGIESCGWNRKYTLDNYTLHTLQFPRPISETLTYAYDTNTQKIRVVLKADEWWPFQVGPCIESLVSLSYLHFTHK